MSQKSGHAPWLRDSKYTIEKSPKTITHRPRRFEDGMFCTGRRGWSRSVIIFWEETRPPFFYDWSGLILSRNLVVTFLFWIRNIVLFGKTRNDAYKLFSFLCNKLCQGLYGCIENRNFMINNFYLQRRLQNKFFFNRQRYVIESL